MSWISWRSTITRRKSDKDIIMKKAFLSFDFEEFDLPKEYGVDIPLEEQIRVSAEGAERLLNILQEEQVPATFFVTGVFATHAPQILQRLIKEGYEVASHGMRHTGMQPQDTGESKHLLEELTGKSVYGYRQPRMMQVSDEQLRKDGYRYNASLNPTWILGRYNHLRKPRTPFMKDQVLQVPASVTPWLRFPLFWLSTHVLPQWLYLWLVRRTLRYDGFFTSYMHPWEFYPLNEHPEWKLPRYISAYCGEAMEERMRHLIQMLKREDASFYTLNSTL